MNASQMRAAALADKALQANANVTKATAQAVENLAKVKEKAIATEAKYSAELSKSRAVLAASVKAAQNVAIPAAAAKVVDKASAQVKKDELAVTKAEEQAEKSLAATRLASNVKIQELGKQLGKDRLAATKAEEDAEKALATTRLNTYNVAQALESKFLANKKAITRAEEDAALVSRKTANIITNAPDNIAGGIKADAARLAEARAQEKVNDLKQKGIQIERDYNQAILTGGKAAAQVEEAGADKIAAASNKVLATKQQLRQAALDGMAAEASTAAAGADLVAAADAKVLASKEQLAQAIVASQAAQGSAVEAAREAEYASASKLAQADAALAASRIASKNSVVAVEEADEARIIELRQTAIKADQAAAAAQSTVAKEASALSSMQKTALIGTGVAAVALAATVTAVGFSYNMTRESAEKAFAGIIHDGPKATAFMDELYGWTRKTSLGFDTAVHSAQEFLARGIALKDVIPYLDTIAEAAAKLPAPMEQSMQRISYAIGQISQSAKLHSQDIRQLTEAGINAWKYLSDATGASIDDMQKDAEKFGLTGPRVAEIILAGMRKDSAGMLQIQAETGRGQISIATRNFQELSGIFTKPLYDKFIAGLKTVNDALSNPSVKAFAEEFGQNIADGIDLAIAPVQKLHDLLTSIPEIKIPKINIPGTDTKIPGTGGSVSAGDIFSIVGKKFANDFLNELTLGVKGNLSRVLGGKNFLENQGFLPTAPANTQEKVDRLLDRRNVLSREAQNYSAGSTPSKQIQAQIAQVDSDLESLKGALNGTGQAGGAAAGKILSLKDAINSTFDQEISKAEANLSTLRGRLEELGKSGPSMEQLQAQANNMDINRQEQPRRLAIADGLKDLDKKARDAADANKAAADAVDENIKSIQRGIDARDRSEARQEIVDKMKLSGSERDQKALDDFDRSIQRATLAAGKSASDLAQEQADIAATAQQRGDLVAAIGDAENSGKHVSKRKQREKAVEDAQKALARFDQEQATKQRIKALKDAEEKQKNADALAKMDKEDAIRKKKEAEDRAQIQKDLAKFDRATSEQGQLQKLQDQRDAIVKAGEGVQKDFDQQKQKLDDELAGMDRAKTLRDQEITNYEDAVKRLEIAAKLVDVDKLPKQGELEQKFTDITKELTKAYDDLKAANDKRAADIAATATSNAINQNAIPGRATGGDVQANQAYIVGEKRAEVFVPKQDGMIYPSIAKALAAMGKYQTGGGIKPPGYDPNVHGGEPIIPGNIDLSNRPRVKNADGSISTIRSINFDEDGYSILAPTVSDDGKILSNQKAIDLYHQTHKHLGIFADDASAELYAKRLHFAEAEKLQARVAGGPVQAGQSYLVGENNPEVYIANALAQEAAAYARSHWPGNQKMEQGEVHAALDGLQGYFQHQKLSQDWIDAYLPYVRQLEQQQQQQNRVTAVGGGSGGGGGNTENHDHKTLHNLGQININMGNNGRPNDAVDYLFQKF